MNFLNTKEITSLLDKSGKYSELISIYKLEFQVKLHELHKKLNALHHQSGDFDKNLKKMINFQKEDNYIYHKAMAEIIAFKDEKEIILFEITDFGAAIFIKPDSNLIKIQELLEIFIDAVQNPDSYIIDKRYQELNKKIKPNSGNSQKIKI